MTKKHLFHTLFFALATLFLFCIIVFTTYAVLNIFTDQIQTTKLLNTNITNQHSSVSPSTITDTPQIDPLSVRGTILSVADQSFTIRIKKPEAKTTELTVHIQKDTTITLNDTSHPPPVNTANLEPNNENSNNQISTLTVGDTVLITPTEPITDTTTEITAQYIIQLQ